MEPRKEVALIGAGKIGKGYIADLFNQAGYHLIFLCHSIKQAASLREQGYYTVFKYDDLGSENDSIKEYRISGFEAYSTSDEYEKCLETLARVNYATVHLYPNGYESIGHMIGDAVKLRMKNCNTEPLDVILCLNYIGAEVIIKNHVLEVLTEKEEKDYFEKYIGIGMSLTFRWGANPRQYMIDKDPHCVCCADSPDLPVDADAFKGIVPPGVALRPLHKMDQRIVYKLWCGNVQGQITANLAMQKGYRYQGEGTADNEIFMASMLGKREGEFGFDQAYNLTQAEKDENFKGRIGHTKKGDQIRVDEVTRVGADPARKLARRDRLIGPAIECMKAGKIPFFLAKAAAAGFYFINPEDRSACEIQEYIKNEGIKKAIIKYCELNLKDRAENMLYQLILNFYYDFDPKDPSTITID